MSVPSLPEFNARYEYRRWLRHRAEEEAAPHSKRSSLLSNIIFYFVITAMVLAAFLYAQRSSTGNSIFGYSYYNILTGSMKPELPPGTFVLVKAVGGTDINVGDDITFYQQKGVVVTHRVIEIFEDYEDSGQFGYRTQGINNDRPDTEIIYEGNVLGKVIWHVPVLGFVFEYIAGHIFLLIGLFVVLILLAFTLRFLFAGGNSHPAHEHKTNEKGGLL